MVDLHFSQVVGPQFSEVGLTHSVCRGLEIGYHFAEFSYVSQFFFKIISNTVAEMSLFRLHLYGHSHSYVCSDDGDVDFHVHGTAIVSLSETAHCNLLDTSDGAQR